MERATVRNLHFAVIELFALLAMTVDDRGMSPASAIRVREALELARLLEDVLRRLGEKRHLRLL